MQRTLGEIMGQLRLNTNGGDSAMQVRRIEAAENYDVFLGSIRDSGEEREKIVSLFANHSFD